jgi:hypothetical protein
MLGSSLMLMLGWTRVCSSSTPALASLRGSRSRFRGLKERARQASATTSPSPSTPTTTRCSRGRTTTPPGTPWTTASSSRGGTARLTAWTTPVLVHLTGPHLLQRAAAARLHRLRHLDAHAGHRVRPLRPAHAAAKRDRLQHAPRPLDGRGPHLHARAGERAPAPGLGRRRGVRPEPRDGERRHPPRVLPALPALHLQQL